MTRTWPALLAWGAGLIHIALGATATRAQQDLSTMLLLVLLLATGAAEMVWGALVLRQGHPVTPRLAVVGALAALVLGAGALMVGGSPIAIAAACGFAVTAGALTARLCGSRSRGGDPSPRGRGRAGAAGLLLGAVLVAAITTPALATTDAGLHVVPHEHETVPGPHAGH